MRYLPSIRLLVLTVALAVGTAAPVALAQRDKPSRPQDAVPSGMTQVLGRPSDRAITLSLLSPADIEAYVEFGTAAGTYGLVAFCPGFTATQSSIAVMGRRLATHGFVVVTIDTNSTSDQPPSRATQLLAALNRVAGLTTGAVAGKVDGNRRAVTGHSMGGGGTLLALRQNTSLRAGVGLAPWSQATKDFSPPSSSHCTIRRPSWRTGELP